MNLDTLENRRVRFDLTLMYKIYNNILDIDFKQHFKNNIAMKNYGLRGHNFKISCANRSKSTSKYRFFCERIVPLWNALPTHLVESPTLEKFKKQLNELDVSVLYTSRL